MRKHIEVFAVNLVIPLNICCHHCCVLCYICYSIPGSFVPLTMFLLKNNVLSLKANANMADLQAEEVDMGMKMLMVSVPGIPGEDYPILQQVKLFPGRIFSWAGFFLLRVFPAVHQAKQLCWVRKPFQVPEESDFSCDDRIPGGDPTSEILFENAPSWTSNISGHKLLCNWFNCMESKLLYHRTTKLPNGLI